MPRRKNASVKGSNATPTRRSARQSASRTTEEQDVPEVFQDLLIEAYQNNPEDFAPSPRPTKRRKVNDELDESTQPLDNLEPVKPTVEVQLNVPETTPSPAPTPPRPLQVVFNNDFSDEDDSDVSFEDVAISRQATPASEDETEKVNGKTLQLDLSRPSAPIQGKAPPRPKSKPLTKVERIHRLNVHKWHLLCLMLHVQTVSRWCDDESVQRTLKPLVARSIIKQLHLPETRTQAERKFSFDSAISNICHIWKLSFKVNTHGMRKAHWRETLNMETELEAAPDPMDFEDFQTAAKLCSGSRDLGAQLFCALMRSLAVDTRLVCSLQVLPFWRAAAANSTPQKAPPTYISAGNQDFGTSTTPSRTKRKKIIDSPYPIWWIEVYSPAVTAWVPLDPLVRNTINKPRIGFEPPASDSLNSMSYVIAFEDDGTAKDVTRRYSSYYNAKTRRARVEVTKGGADWFSSVMKYFSKPPTEQQDRDDIEDAALNRRLAQEGMPKNVQDFKDHPIYVLERHLRSNEVIEPRRECGKFSVGTGKNTRLENVYRRENVHACRSSEGWYRRGRDIQPGQQPLKRAIPRKRREGSLPVQENEDGEDNEGVPLYAEFQTEIYTPPPVVDGKIPRNGYGNLDVYVASMIPAGGIHIRHLLAGQAAKALKIDAAEAVTGFIFKGRQGTAVIDGVVVDSQYTAAMLTSIEALEEQLEDEINAQRHAIMMSVWKKMHAVLKVRQRIQEDYGDKAGIKMDAGHDDSDDDSTYEQDDDDGGGFLPDVQGEATRESKAQEAENLAVLKDRAPIVLPPVVVRQRPVVVRSPHKLPGSGPPALHPSLTEDLFGDSEVEAGGFLPDDGPSDVADNGGGFMVEDTPPVNEKGGGGFIPEDTHQEAGGFVPESNNEMAGSFIPEDDTAGGFLPEASSSTQAVSPVAPPEPPHSMNVFNPTPDPSTIYPSRPIPTRRESLPSLSDPSKVAPPMSNPPQPTLPDITASVPSSQDTKSSLSQSSTRKKLQKSKQKQKQVEEKIETGSLSDNSLPSHDPEEDDLEPAWVEDAFEDF